MSTWLEKIAKTFMVISGHELTKEELVSLESDDFPDDKTLTTEPVEHIPRIVRLHKELDSVGIQERGRLVEIVSATGYSRQQVSRFLTGATAMPQHFVVAVCRAYNLDMEGIWGTDLRISPEAFRVIAEHHEKMRPKEFEKLDAPTQEIIKEIQRLSEPNRWVFVGRAKAIIEEMIIKESGAHLEANSLTNAYLKDYIRPSTSSKNGKP
jgi:hypothetical protein